MAQIALEFTGNILAYNEANNAVEAVMPPEIDGEAEHLADHAGITPRQAEAALEWMRGRELEEIRRAAGDVVGRLFAEIVPATGKIEPRVVGLRFLASSFLLNRTGETLTHLAERCGVSKQLADYHALWVGDRIGFHGFAQKRTEARASYAAAQRQSWSRLTPEERKARRAGKKPNTPAAQDVAPAA